jgi:hypothetical protein
MKVKKKEFDAVLGAMLKAEPQKRSETKPLKQTKRKTKKGGAGSSK